MKQFQSYQLMQVKVGPRFIVTGFARDRNDNGQWGFNSFDEAVTFLNNQVRFSSQEFVSQIAS